MREREREREDVLQAKKQKNLVDGSSKEEMFFAK